MLATNSRVRVFVGVRVPQNDATHEEAKACGGVPNCSDALYFSDFCRRAGTRRRRRRAAVTQACKLFAMARVQNKDPGTGN